MPKRVKMKGVPRGAFGGMGDRVMEVKATMGTGTRRVQKGLDRMFNHPLYPGPKPPFRSKN